MPRFVPALAVGLLAASMAMAAVGSDASSAPLPRPAPATDASRTPAPAPGPDLTALFAATLIDLDGRPQSLAGLRGRPLLVNFWARWCVPCRREIPELIRARHRHPQVTVVGIALEESPEAVREFARAYEIDYPVLLAGAQGPALLAALDDPAAGLPYTLLVDRDGRVLARRLGGMSRSDLERGLRRLSRAR